MASQSGSTRSRPAAKIRAAPSSLQVLRERLRDVAAGRLFVSIPEAASILGWSRATTYRAINLGTLPSTKMNGRMRRVSLVQLERFVAGADEGAR